MQTSTYFLVIRCLKVVLVELTYICQAYDDIVDSIKNQLYILPKETIVYPGHGFTTTIEIEKRTNPFHMRLDIF